MSTKPKKPRQWTAEEWNLLAPLQFAAREKAAIGKLLGLDGRQLATAVVDISRALEIGTALVVDKMSEPLPANLRAELEPIIQAVEALQWSLQKMSRKNRSRTESDGLLAELSVWHRKATSELQCILALEKAYREALSIGDAQSLGGSDGGARKKNVRVARDALRRELEKVYDKHAPAATDRARKQFVTLLDRLSMRPRTNQELKAFLDQL